jgi:DnaK suppressor protein
MIKTITKEELLTMPADEYMNDVQLAYFKGILTQQKSEILADMENVKKELIGSEKNADMNDVASTYESQQLELKRVDRERKLLNKINHTLANIDNGEYGYCEVTGDEIGLKRMIARPTATMTIEAKERQEFKEKTVGEN